MTHKVRTAENHEVRLGSQSGGKDQDDQGNEAGWSHSGASYRSRYRHTGNVQQRALGQVGGSPALSGLLVRHWMDPVRPRELSEFLMRSY